MLMILNLVYKVYTIYRVTIMTKMMMMTCGRNSHEDKYVHK